MDWEAEARRLGDEVVRLREYLAEEREACAQVALQQRCERRTPWDAACVAIAAAIRARGK